MIELSLDWKRGLGYVVCDDAHKNEPLTKNEGVGYAHNLIDALLKYINCKNIDNSEHVCLSGSDFRWLINELDGNR